MSNNSRGLSRFIMFLFLGAVLVYFCVYFFQSLNDSIRTQAVYQSSMEDSIEVSGFLTRSEVVIPAVENGVVDVLLGEGEKVGRYQTIANIHQTENGPELTRRIGQLEQELEQLEDTQSRSIDTGDTLKLGGSIVDSIVALRGSVAQGNLTNLESQTSDLKSLVFKRSYTYEGSDVTLDETISSLAQELDGLRSEYARNTSSITAAMPGIYSGLVDGYESLLTPAMLQTISAAALDDLARHPPNVDDDAVGKLVTASNWYLSFPCSAEQAARFTAGATLTVRFTRDISEELPMTVYWVGEADSDGRCVVSLTSDRYLAATTLLRQQSVDVIFGRSEGLHIPKSALRVDEEGNPGIYTVVGVQAEYKPVRIVAEGEDYFLVLAADDRKTSLRQGEEVIISGAGLFDGKVVK